MPRFMGAMMKLAQQYGKDPEVKKAMEKMQSLGR